MSANTRERIAQAAFALFQKNGYENVTMQDISRAAGLSRKTVYTYYRSKEDIVAQRYAHLVEGSSRELMVNIATMNSYRDKLSFLYFNIAEQTCQFGPDIAKSVMCSYLSGKTFYGWYHPEEKEAEADRFFIELIRLGQEHGEFRQDLPPEVLHRAFVCAMSGALVHWVAHGGKRDKKTFLQQLFQLIFDVQAPAKS